MAGTELVIPERTTKLTFKADLARFDEQITAVAYRGFGPDRIKTGAMQAALANPAIFECDPASLCLALVRAARLGLDIGESGVYLVPLEKTVKTSAGKRTIKVVEGWVDYRGLKLLAMRAGLVRSMDEYVIREGDEWEHEIGLNPRLIHRPRKVAKDAPILAAYSLILKPGHVRTYHLLEIDEIEERRQKSRQWNPTKIPRCPAWWAKKAVVRDYLGRQPKTAEMIEALAADDVAEERPVLVSDDGMTAVDPETGEILNGPMSEEPDVEGDA